MLGLIEAGALAEDDSVLVAIDRLENPLPLLPGCLAGDDFLGYKPKGML